MHTDGTLVVVITNNTNKIIKWIHDEIYMKMRNKRKCMGNTRMVVVV